MRFTSFFLVPVAALLAQAATIMVNVSENSSVTFNPTSVMANVNDVIAFKFLARNHTVTQSTFANPCSMMTTPKMGADSGFFPVAAGTTTFPMYNYTVTNASAPLWFYCRQTGHCQQGMVFAVNPTAALTFQAFQAKAMGTNASSMMPSGTSASMPASSTTTKTSGALGSYGGSAAIMATLSGLLAGLFLQ